MASLPPVEAVYALILLMDALVSREFYLRQPSQNSV